MRTGRTVLITGGAGFIGSHLVDDALAHGERVVVLDDLSTGKRENVPAGVIFHERDLLAPGLDELLASERVDVVNHHAAQANVRVSLEDPAADARVNIMGSLKLLTAAKRVGVRKFLFASSGGTVYGEQEVYPCDEDHPKRPSSPYGVAKYSVELYLEAFRRAGELDPVVLRYANVYGPRQEPKGEAGIVAILAEKLLTGQTARIFDDGEQTRDYVHVRDVVALNRAVMDRWIPGAYNVGTGVETTVNQLYRKVSEALGVDVPPQHVPPLLAEMRRNCLDASRAGRVLGVRPRLSVDEGLTLTLPWYRTRHGG